MEHADPNALPNWEKKLSQWTPELYFLAFAFWWGFYPFVVSSTTGTGDIKHPAFILAIVLILQFFLKSRLLGQIVSVLIGLYSAWLILALISDLIDSFNVNILVVGSLIIITNLTMSVVMLIKYTNKKMLGH